jgi:hypothetical protein
MFFVRANALQRLPFNGFVAGEETKTYLRGRCCTYGESLPSIRWEYRIRDVALLLVRFCR